MAREHRVLTALGAQRRTGAADPRAVHRPGVIGAPFYVMAEARGAILRTASDTAGLTPGHRGRVGRVVRRTLADLHGLDPDSRAVGDYGRPAGFIARQLRRWGEQWSRSRTRDLPDMDLLARLAATSHRSQPPTAVVHGDYRLDNTIVDLPRADPRVVAVLDWELSTLGDPLADLGLTMTYWQDPGDDERDRSRSRRARPRRRGSRPGPARRGLRRADRPRPAPAAVLPRH